jgi:hypothetical protein
MIPTTQYERLYRHDIPTLIDLADHVRDLIDEFILSVNCSLTIFGRTLCADFSVPGAGFEPARPLRVRGV